MQEKHPPPKPPPHLRKKGIEDILDIDSHCPYLLFGETTSHLAVSHEILKNNILKFFVFNI